MKIETKLNVGDEAWFMRDNKTCSDDVVMIRVEVEFEGIARTPISTIEYLVGNFGSDDWYDESVIFASKKELLESL